MAPGPSKKKAGAGGTFLGIALFVAALCIAAGIAFVYYNERNRPGLDAATLCPQNGPVAHLAILVDTTDPLTLTHLQSARQIIEQRVADAAVGTRISFSTVSPDSDIRRSAFFSLCKPPSGAEASQLTQNPRMIEETFQKDFARPLDNALTALLTIEEATSSPIMEALQEFVSTIPDFNTADAPRELVMMTDLMQHSETFSFYRGGAWKSFADASGPESFGQNFDGARVSVLRIPRRVEMADIVDDFWVRYFDAQGFDRVNIMTIGDL